MLFKLTSVLYPPDATAINQRRFFFSKLGTVTNPAIWLVLSKVWIFLSLTTITVTEGGKLSCWSDYVGLLSSFLCCLWTLRDHGHILGDKIWDELKSFFLISGSLSFGCLNFQGLSFCDNITWLRFWELQKLPNHSSATSQNTYLSSLLLILML